MKTTELDAINIMLEVIGETPINSLSDLLPVDAVVARNILNETSKAVQSKGWNFNKEYDYTLTPDSTTHEINVPDNFVFVEVHNRDIAIRANKLYDREDHSYIFDGDSLIADIIQILPFTDLPEQARYYITIRAARIFQTRVLGSDTLYKFSEEEEYRAKVALQQFDSRLGNRSMLGQKANLISHWHPYKVLLR